MAVVTLPLWLVDKSTLAISSSAIKRNTSVPVTCRRCLRGPDSASHRQTMASWRSAGGIGQCPEPRGKHRTEMSSARSCDPHPLSTIHPVYYSTCIIFTEGGWRERIRCHGVVVMKQRYVCLGVGRGLRDKQDRAAGNRQGGSHTATDTH